ncbi:Phytanoyl-CoA dioxygenase [Methylobacterium sp. 4-46]|uniref:phytanoyl-CoA dioxygenase family protein n=1 Tax=unclassified Methylobacterium TaxID=2615210 RepID=UPI000165CA12|nr:MULTISPECIES: phytanoyl-CoA dioxygenase family protein [Methylobacterium]ACA16384.1 Phytanoyl-CoA dioxygenase [Methylobacterium sp. 4-46]WFT83534.1 phytanoyl-CoA dioxygenase family protein [Methylobacterium nodulans]
MAATVSRLLLAPIHAIQVLTGAKSFRSNPILGSASLNRRGLHVWRVNTATALTARRRRRLASLVSAEDQRQLDEQGYLEVRDFLEPGHFADLVQEVTSVALPARQFREGDAVTRRVPLTLATLRQLPACRRLLEMPGFQGRLRYVASFDVEPEVYIQTIFSQLDGSQADPQLDLHMDTFHPTMKAWLFLHDVPEDEGPFTYVRGSATRSKRRLAWERRKSVEACDPTKAGGGGAFRIRPEELPRLGLSAPVKFAVPGNTLVVGDTCGFHARGATVRPGVRIEIYAANRRNPFLPFVGLDPWSLPLLRRRKIPLFWSLLALGGGSASFGASGGTAVEFAPATRFCQWSICPSLMGWWAGERGWLRLCGAKPDRPDGPEPPYEPVTEQWTKPCRGGRGQAVGLYSPLHLRGGLTRSEPGGHRSATRLSVGSGRPSPTPAARRPLAGRCRPACCAVART